MGPDVYGLPDSPGKSVGVSIQYLRIFKLDVVAWVILVDMFRYFRGGGACFECSHRLSNIVCWTISFATTTDNLAP